MSLVESLIEFLHKKGTKEELVTPEGVCPNCWGREEYAGHFHERLRKENYDITTVDKEVGWINDYANKHLQSIAVKKRPNTDEPYCEKCSVSYKQID